MICNPSKFFLGYLYRGITMPQRLSDSEGVHDTRSGVIEIPYSRIVTHYDPASAGIVKVVIHQYLIALQGCACPAPGSYPLRAGWQKYTAFGRLLTEAPLGFAVFSEGMNS